MKILKIIIATIIISFPAIAGALEVGFPGVGTEGYTPGDSAGPAEWIRYIYLLSMGLVGLALIYTFARAGIEWVTSGENQGRVGSAKKRIQGGIIGLLILLGSYLFLQTINPQLVAISNPQIETSGTDEGLFGFITSMFRRNSEGNFFMGYEAGHICSSPTDCVNGLTCTAGVCAAGERPGSAIISCSNDTPCPSGQRCFDDTNLSSLVNINIPYSGTCSSLKAIGEDCDVNVAVACRGNNWCDPNTKKCVLTPGR